MYFFLTKFGMHDICMWIIGHDLSLAWMIVDLFSLFFLVVSHVSLPWVELLVLEPWLEKCFGVP